MKSFARLALPLLGLTLSAPDPSFTQQRDRAKIPDQYKWNLADIYPSDEAWKEAKQKLTDELPVIKKYQSTLGTSPQQLLGCLDLITRLRKEFMRLYSFASMNLHQDTRVQTYQAMQQEMDQIGVAFSTKSAFIEPEILKIDPEKIQEFLKSEKKLEVYRFYLNDIPRRRAHTGTEGEEKIIADAGLMSTSPENIHSIFANADFIYPEVTLSDGKTVKIDQAGYTLYRALPNREDRKKVFSTFFQALNKFYRTYGADLNAQVNKDLFYKNARNYSSCLESSLDASNIPTQVYINLVDNVNKNLSTFHRYLKLRQRILGVDQLHYYDLYAPLLADVDLKYSIEKSQELIIAALKPLGKDYVSIIMKAFNERWIDVYPTDSKRSGAYSNSSVYDVHPYILLNYNGKFDDISTVAHELGHTMHGYLSNTHQPYATADSPTFVAEVASTFNEALLIDHMLKQIKDDNVRLSLLGTYIENIRQNVFRQTQFAEFELRIHEMAEQGKPLTGELLNNIYDDIVKKYYGHEQKVCVVDDEIKAEWIYIPHFYYNFYVYQYATAYTASAALSERTLPGNESSTKKYIEFLSSGGSDYPINLLKKAGIDMTASEPFELTMKKMNRVMDEMEKILNKKKK